MPVRVLGPVGEEIMKKANSKKTKVRLQAAKDLVIKEATERNPAARTVKDTCDTLNDLEKLRTGEDRSLQ